MKDSLSARQGELAAAGTLTDSKSAVAAPRGPATPAFDAATTASEVALGELRRLLGAWRQHEPGARLGHDPEALHQLRVTARRIDATLGLFRRQLPVALTHARRTAKSVLRTLGAARDLDVQLAELARHSLALPESERAAVEPLRARLESERCRARARMIRALDSEPTRRWLEALTAASAAAPSAAGAFGERAMVVMPERVRRRFRKLRNSVRGLRSNSPMEDYHLVRRRAKQLRYAIESGALIFGKPAEDELKALRRLQDELGAHQDAYMAR
ncbi:MAG: CHAD domain-containing protein, partial [Gammaproteobacteria bacterium]